jgi:hypothetical protein
MFERLYSSSQAPGTVANLGGTVLTSTASAETKLYRTAFGGVRRLAFI